MDSVVHLPEAVGDLPRRFVVASVVAARGPTRAVHRGRGQEVLERPARSDRNHRDAGGQADHDHRGCIRLKSGDCGLCPEEPADLVADRREELVGARAFGDECRHPAQGGLLSGQILGARFGGCELGAALGIRDRGRHELGELRDVLLGVGREAFARVGDKMTPHR